MAVWLSLLRPAGVAAPKTEYPEIQAYVMQGNTFMGRSAVSKPDKKVLASLVGKDLFDDLHFKGLIRCICEKESSFNPRAVGDHGESVGCVQAYKWREPDSWWQEWCVAKYEFDDVWDCRQQVLCADYTLQEDFGQLYVRWPNTWGKCLK